MQDNKNFQSSNFRYFIVHIFSGLFLVNISFYLVENFITKKFAIIWYLVPLFLMFLAIVSTSRKKFNRIYFRVLFMIAVLAYFITQLFVLIRFEFEVLFLLSFPFISSFYFFKNQKISQSFNLLFLFLLILYYSNSTKVQFKTEFEIRFLASYIVVCLIVFFVIRIINQYEKHNAEIISDLEKQNQKLQLLQNQLNENLKQLTHSNFELQNHKKILELNEFKLKRLLEDIGEGFAITDLDGNFLYVNPAFCNIFESDENHLLTLNIFDFLDVEKKLIIKQLFVRTLKKSTNSQEINIDVNDKDKKLILTVSPQYDFNDQIVGFILLLRDITEIITYQETLQLKNEELTAIEEELRMANDELVIKQDELQRVNERLYTIFENLPVGIVLYDPLTHKIKYVNPYLLKLIKFFSFIDDDIENYLNLKNITKETSTQIIKDTKGNDINVFTTSTQVKFNETDLLLISYVDITELTKAQQTIIRQKKLQETLIDNIPDFIYIKDTKLNYLIVNKALAEDIGLPVEKIINHNVAEFLSPELAFFYNKLDIQVLETKKPIYDIEQKFVSPQGKERWTLVTKIPLFDENNQIYGIVGISRDITEQKNKEQIIIEKNRQFENTINNLEDIYIKTDFEGNLLYYSPSIEKHLDMSILDIISNKTIQNFIKNIYNQYQQNPNFVLKNINVEFQTSKDIFYGIANLSLWTDSSGNYRGFEGIITNTTQITKLQKELLNKNKILNISLEITSYQKEKLESLYKDLTDNINYAKTIQMSMLPNLDVLQKVFGKFFLIYEPKDIVGGDFYFVIQKKEIIYFAVGDCTGHGVTGAFLTILSISYLNQILYQHIEVDTAQILNILRSQIQQTFINSGNLNTNGLDISLCAYNKRNNKLLFSGANQSIIIYVDNRAITYNGDRMPIGFYIENRPFSVHEYDISAQRTIVYLFSDGFYDQFTSNEDEPLKKFGIKRLRQLIETYGNEDIDKQKYIFKHTFETWKGYEDQIDDITVLAVEL